MSVVEWDCWLFIFANEGVKSRSSVSISTLRKWRKGTPWRAPIIKELSLREHNVITEELPDFRGNVALFDVLHYLPPAAQQTLLQTLARAVLPGGMFLLRDAPRDGSARFWLTYAGELFAQTIRWNVGVPLHFATRASIAAAFPPEDWIHHEQPAWGGTPFNNRLFTFRRRPA